MNHKRKRIQNANPYLRYFLKENEHFYVGLLFEDFLSSTDFKKYNLPESFTPDKESIPAARGSVTKANIQGKYIRKQPEEKTTKTVHIKYRRKDGTRVEFDRDYNVFVRELQHKYNLPLYYKINHHGQKIVVTERLTFNSTPENIIKNTHAVNILCEISNDFEIFNANLEPAINFNKRFEADILPKGKLSEKTTIDELEKFAERYTRNNEENKAFQKRLHVLKNFDPDIRGKGPNNFFGYIVFGFSDLGIVVLETMYDGNATYIFSLDTYENTILKDKQTVLKNGTMLKRFIHKNDWEKNITNYLKSLKK